MHVLSQPLSGSLSGFYLFHMIYHPAIKNPFTAALRALQGHGGNIPTTAAGECGGSG